VSPAGSCDVESGHDQDSEFDGAGVLVFDPAMPDDGTVDASPTRSMEWSASRQTVVVQ